MVKKRDTGNRKDDMKKLVFKWLEQTQYLMQQQQIHKAYGSEKTLSYALNELHIAVLSFKVAVVEAIIGRFVNAR